MRKDKMQISFRQVLKFSIYTVAVCVLNSDLYGQHLKITPVNKNHSLKRINSFQPNHNLAMLGISDTLDLPFFEDFNEKTTYPLATRWTDKHVFVNNTFAKSPPTIGVATFDHLNQFGNPYNGLNKTVSSACDTLTVQPINLKTYKSGINTVGYSANDSVYLSFFYQPQGWGDYPESTDSLVLQFKNVSGQWKTVWKVSGTSSKSFNQVLVGLKSSTYFYNDFQFRFINFSKNTGNLNHWHLDYIRMARNRTYKDLEIKEVAINYVDGRLLKNYFSMPYNQFKANVAGETDASHYMTLRNNNSQVVLTGLTFSARNRYGKVIGKLDAGLNDKNILAGRDSLTVFNSFRMDTLSGKNPFVDVTYQVAPQSNDGTSGNYNATGNNNISVTLQQFNNYLAYDDGTAEGGIGLDYSFKQDNTGLFAVKYNLNTPDTLRGVAIYFNQSDEDVSARPFVIRVWKTITEPPASNTNDDVLITEMLVLHPEYTDSINGFHYFVFDSAVLMPAGAFYVGWKQSAKFVLNIGYDNNYRNLHQNSRNPNVYYNLSGYWEKPEFEVQGAPMIRPLLGAKIPNKVNIVSPIKVNATLRAYPNPSDGNVRVEMPVKGFYSFELYDIEGKLIDKGERFLNKGETHFEFDKMKGVYFLKLKSDKNTFTTTPLIFIH